MRLCDSLSNPSTPLIRLLELQRQGALTQANADPQAATTALIKQTGASDLASVRLEAKENRKLSPDEIVEVVRRYEAGASIRSLSATFRLHEQTVRAHLRRQNVKLRPVRVLSGEQEAEVVRLYVEETWSLAELAGKFRVSASAVRSALVRRGVERRKRIRRNK